MNIFCNKISFRNFMSFGNQMTEIILNKPGVLMLMGENLDVGGSSGSGKSSILNTIFYAVWDKIPSGVSKDKIINRNNDKKNTLLEVIFEFTKEKDSYKIRRTRGEKTSIQLWKNGIDITPDSVYNCNAEIEKIFGISYNLASHIILFRGKSRPFLDLPIGEQRNLIEELFGITTLSSKARSLKKLISTTEKSKEIEILLINQQKNQIANHNKHIDDIAKRAESWEIEKDSNINNIKFQLAKISNVNFEEEERFHNIISTHKSTIQEFIVDANLLSSKRTILEKELSKEVKELLHLEDSKCPYCLQQFENSSNKIIELKNSIRTKQENITEFDQISNNLMIEIEKDKETLLFFQEKIKHPDLVELSKIRSNKNILSQQLIDLQKSTNPHIETLDQLMNNVLIVDETKLNQLDKTITHQQFLLKLLIDKNSFIRKKILSKSIPFLNKRIEYRTNKVNLPHIVKFQPDMSCEISQYSRELDHGNLSDGEQKRLNIAMCLAFRDTKTYLHNKINLLFTDEIDGGSLCPDNTKHLTELLKQEAWENKVSIFCVSHSQVFQDAFDNHLIIRKESGFSTVINTSI